MRNPDYLADTIRSTDFIAVSWNLHKGRSALGFAAWQAMRRWVQTIHADAYFLQEAMARRMRQPIPSSLPSSKFSINERLTNNTADFWHCQATELADTLELDMALGANVLRSSRRYGNAILSSHLLDSGRCLDISAHRFERRGLLVTRAKFGRHSVTLLCAHLALTRSARLRQMHWVAHWIAKETPDGPLVLAGDFNDWRNDSVSLFAKHRLNEVATLLGEPMRTFPAFSPTFALDKMFVRGMKPVELIQPAIETAWLSDHLPYIARLRVE